QLREYISNYTTRPAPVRTDRRLYQDFVVTVEKRAIAIRRRQLVPPEIGDITPTQVSDIAPLRWFLHEIERRSFHSRRDAVEPFAVEQGEIQRRDGIVVRMPHYATVHPMGDVVPHAVAFDSHADSIAARRDIRERIRRF